MDIRAILAGLAFALMWSSAFTSARIIVLDASPLAALTLRYLISGLLGVGIALALGQSWRLTPAQWRGTIIFGILQNAVYLGLNFVAMQTVQASLAAIIASTMPLLVALALWLMGERLRPLGLVGLAAGLVGVTIIMGARITGGVDMLGLLLCIIGVIALTLATLLVRGLTSGGNFLMIVGLQMLVGFVTLALATLAFETPRVNVSLPLILAFAYTVLVPGLLATVVWFWLVDRIGATRAATFHFLNPFFGVAIAALLLSESLGAQDVLGVTIIALGILAVQLSRQRRA
ncbi:MULTISPECIES: DMT family transporter [unclassified Sulfitobacter]|jgi:probable blue pigment (indigoidine) exporter|uniref:DMT family transporter n=1 Tax=unclassified Sulfitobacter TaxID=196795 RepID=UPI0007C223AF|nr:MULTISPECIES: DMT family transporter [unclassified Sulfitobacter]KZX93880.1 peptide ABC transporter permease [Sulfitobacter sp. HI0023]KZY26252.1 peptide ABC transporter permease [Sulfitobacter sp. HI0040]KZZ64700.1 peptide ABC transporter permease [Sulfitobacter sp. HI0129]